MGRQPRPQILLGWQRELRFAEKLLRCQDVNVFKRRSGTNPLQEGRDVSFAPEKIAQKVSRRRPLQAQDETLSACTSSPVAQSRKAPLARPGGVGL